MSPKLTPIRVLTALLALLVVMVPVFAFAQTSDPTTPDGVSVFVDELLKLVFGVGGTAATGLFVALLTKALKSVNLYNASLMDSRLEYIVQNAIHYAEERTAALVKSNNLPVKAATGVRKLETAIAFVLDKAPGIERAEAEQLVHAYLARLGNGATQFVQDMKAAASN
jgi:hypothetical protein